MALSPLSVKRFRWGYITVWITWSLLHAYVLYDIGWSWPVALTDSFISNTLLGACCLLISMVLRYYQPRRGRYVFVVAWCVMLAGVFLGLSNWLLYLSLDDQPGYYAFLQSSLLIRFGIAVPMTGWIAMISMFWYNMKEHQEKEQRQASTEKLAREAELYKLRQQLHPHFLFNSLNSINALIGTRPEEARKMIQQLSDFLRGTLKKEEQQWVTMAEEIQHLQLYLDIEKVRFGHRLSTVVTSDEACSAMRLPPMLLQPIVENAIKFGLYDTTAAVAINITAICTDHQLQITVQNPFDAETSQPRRGTGFGLTGVKRRLYLLFARHDLLQTSVDGNLFTTTIKIPQV